jgi:hypothetical protein
MATVKTYASQIEAMLEDIKQKENRLKELIQKKKEQDRKDRTHRLIERGAILESLIDEPETFTNEQIKTFLEKTIQTMFAAKILTQFKGNNTAEQPFQQIENVEETGEKSETEQVTLDEG